MLARIGTTASIIFGGIVIASTLAILGLVVVTIVLGESPIEFIH